MKVAALGLAWLACTALLLHNALHVPYHNDVQYRKAWHERNVKPIEPWLHNLAFFHALDAKFSSVCGAELAVAVGRARGDAASAALHCVGDGPARYCFAETVCVSRDRGIVVAVDSDGDVATASLRMHGGFAGYCGTQNWTVPIGRDAVLDTLMMQRVDHGPVVIGELCEAAHYAHGVGTNTYPLFLQALRISAAADGLRARSHDGSTLHGVSLVANRMYGSVQSPVGRKLNGMPMEGMLDPMFINGGVEQFWVPGTLDPPAAVTHCYSPAIIGLRNTCPLPSDVCSRGVSTAEHCLYQMYVVKDAEAHVNPGDSDRAVFGSVIAESPAALQYWGPSEDPRYAAPLLVIVQRKTSRMIENMDEVLDMLRGFAQRVRDAACATPAEHADLAASADVLPVYSQAAATRAEKGDVSLLQAESDIARLAALPDFKAAECDLGGSPGQHAILRWRVVSLEGMSVRQQVRLFSRTNILVSACGNSNTNMLWMPLGSSFIQTCPYGVLDPYWDFMLPMTRVRHTPMFCEGLHCLPRPDVAMNENPKQRNMTISVDALYAVLVRELSSLYTQAQQVRTGTGPFATIHDDLLRAWQPECL